MTFHQKLTEFLSIFSTTSLQSCPGMLKVGNGREILLGMESLIERRLNPRYGNLLRIESYNIVIFLNAFFSWNCKNSLIEH